MSRNPRYAKHSIIRGRGKSASADRNHRYYVEDHRDGAYLLRPLFLPWDPSYDYALWDFAECEEATELEWHKAIQVVRLDAKGAPVKEGPDA